MELLAITFLVLGIAAALIVRRHLREAKLLRLREITHQEKMAAMKQNPSVPQTDDTQIESLLVGGAHSGILPEPPSRAGVHWVRMAALVLGLAGLFGGVGTGLALYGVSDPEINGMWPMGLIPIFVGIGLLLFVRLSRGFVEKMNGT